MTHAKAFISHRRWNEFAHFDQHWGPGLPPLFFAVAVGLLLSAFFRGWVIRTLLNVLREERYLERKFGDEYRRYKSKVPRYWWRF
jgi:protein-S-isoprenylcysteine O-methyltransferase Ste14